MNAIVNIQFLLVIVFIECYNQNKKCLKRIKEEIETNFIPKTKNSSLAQLIKNTNKRKEKEDIKRMRTITKALVSKLKPSPLDDYSDDEFEGFGSLISIDKFVGLSTNSIGYCNEEK